jgi:hypothetical protein
MSRTPLPVRIAIWRRRVVAGSLALFAAAWIAVAGFGRQATSTAAAGQSAGTGSSATQTSAQVTDPYSTYDDSESSEAQTDSAQSDATQSDSGGQSNDMSGATTRQS